MNEKYKTSENMKVFFENLEKLKAFVKAEYDKTGDETFGMIYREMHRIYKTDDEVENEM